MADPTHARDRGRYGRYYMKCSDTCPIPVGGLISVTNAQGVVAKPALAPAAAKVTERAAWDRLGLMLPLSRQPEDPNGCSKKKVAERCGRCRFCVGMEIRRAHRVEWQAKADLGTRVHYMAADLVLGKPIDPDPEAAPFVRQYIAWQEAWGVDVENDYEFVELTVFDPGTKTRIGYAGTADMGVWLTVNGKRGLWLNDAKTSLTSSVTTVYPDQVLQLAALRYAPHTLLPDDTAGDVPRFEGTAILNLRQDAHALIPLPATREAHKAFKAAVELKAYFDHGLGDGVKTWKPLDLPEAPEPKKATRRRAA